MKKLIIVRHAKAEQTGGDKTDFDRALAKRGLKDAALIAGVLQEMDIVPDLLLSSPAKRARQTAEIFAGVMDYAIKEIVFFKEMYDFFNISQLSVMINTAGNKADNIMIFGHNPTFADLAYRLTDDFKYHLPTCGVVGIDLNIEHWDELRPSAGHMAFFEFPKKYKE